MGLFGKIGDMLGAAVNDLTASVSRFVNDDFLKAAIASAYLISSADGNVDADEKKKLLGFCERNDALKAFPRTKVLNTFNELAEEFDFDATMGAEKAWNWIKAISGKNDEQSRACVLLACVIGGADGKFDDGEKRVARQIANVLGVMTSSIPALN